MIQNNVRGWIARRFYHKMRQSYKVEGHGGMLGDDNAGDTVNYENPLV
jgi:hypothetical protein